jgi:uncharacterized protein
MTLPTSDVVLSALYAGVLENSKGEEASLLQASQREWLKKRNVCGKGKAEETQTCLAEAYQERLEELFEVGARSGTLPTAKEGSYRPFTSTSWKAPPNAEPSLVTKMNKFLNQTGDGEYIVITQEKGGALRIEGSSLGANGHACGLDGEPLLKLKGRAEYYVSLGGDTESIEDVENGSVMSLKFVPPYLLVSGGRDFCGMRAGWADIYQFERAVSKSSGPAS